jgi:hypothetical protein
VAPPDEAEQASLGDGEADLAGEEGQEPSPPMHIDDGEWFDGFEGFHGKKVSYSSQPKAR